MKRQEIKDILFEMGASTKMLEMPAVMERIYNYYIDENEKTIREEINIGPNGEIECKIDDKYNRYPNGVKRGFYIEKNGECVFVNNEQNGTELGGRYFIDEFGMDRMFTDDYALIDHECTVERTEKGTVEVNGGVVVQEDQGDPILNYSNYTVLKVKSSRTIGWEGNKDFLTKYYPITKEWFEIREGIRTQDIKETKDKELNDEVRNLENRIKTMEEQHKEEIDKLSNQVNKLSEEKQALQGMLNRALELCKTVKESPFGKIFFGRKLKELPDAPNDDER